MSKPMQCKAKSRRSGKQCGNKPMRGQEVCRMHGGSTPAAKKKAKERVAEQEAKKAVELYGLPREVEPHDALLEELHRTAGHVAWLSMKIQALEETQMHGPVGGGKEAYPREEPHVWIRVYQEERTHLAKVARSCIEAGIEERRVKIAEQQGQLLASVIKGILGDLGIADKPEVGRVVRKHLTVVAGQ